MSTTIMYRTQKNMCGQLIKPVVVEKTTDKSVWVNGNRELRVTEYHRYHETFEEARRYLLFLLDRKIMNAETIIESAQKTKSELLALKSV